MFTISVGVVSRTKTMTIPILIEEFRCRTMIFVEHVTLGVYFPTLYSIQN
jgi:hypothetical protein